MLVCPRCGDTFNHFDGDPTRGFEGKTGDWKIPVKCETENHNYFVVFSEHKGNIYVWVEMPSTDSETDYLSLV